MPAGVRGFVLLQILAAPMAAGLSAPLDRPALRA
jgi:hypothetical protein